MISFLRNLKHVFFTDAAFYFCLLSVGLVTQDTVYFMISFLRNLKGNLKHVFFTDTAFYLCLLSVGLVTHVFFTSTAF